MGFVKKTWEDRVSTYPNRRKLINTSTNEEMIVDVERSEGTVVTEGSLLNASAMNDLENRIDLAIQEGGSGGGNSNVKEVTLEEYEALGDETIDDDVTYFITDLQQEGGSGGSGNGGGSASDITYDNSVSGLTSEDTQGAIDELNSNIGEVNSKLEEIETSFSTAANEIGNAIVAVGGTVPVGATFAEMAAIIVNSMISTSDIIGEAVSFSSPTIYTGGNTALSSGSSIVCNMDIAKLSITMTVGVNCWSTDSWRTAWIDGYVYKNGSQVAKVVSCTANGGSDTGGSNTGTGTYVLTDLKAGDVITVNYSTGSNNAEARYPSISGTATVIEM